VGLLEGGIDLLGAVLQGKSKAVVETAAAERQETQAAASAAAARRASQGIMLQGREGLSLMGDSFVDDMMALSLDQQGEGEEQGEEEEWEWEEEEGEEEVTVPVVSATLPAPAVLDDLASLFPSPATAAAAAPAPFVVLDADAGVQEVEAEAYTLLTKNNSSRMSCVLTFTRKPSPRGPRFVCCMLQLRNHSRSPLRSLQVGQVEMGPGRSLVPFRTIPQLDAQSSVCVPLELELGGKSSSFRFQLCSNKGTHWATLEPPVGELLCPSFMTQGEFAGLAAGLVGMHAKELPALLPSCGDSGLTTRQMVLQRVLRVAFLAVVTGGQPSGPFYLAGRTAPGNTLVLVAVLDAATGCEGVEEEGAMALTVRVHSEDFVCGGQLARELVNALELEEEDED
jgi:hypothetical protein